MSKNASDLFKASLFNPLVKLHYVTDLGPGTKFLYVIKEHLEALQLQHKREGVYDEAVARKLIVICDDDMWYSPTLIESFIRRHRQFPDYAIGDRGWRIRPDLVWGVTLAELVHHVILASEIAEPYRVGIITANFAYLIQPRFFLHNHAHNILNDTMKPEEAYWMDDIWINGWLAVAGVQRWVIPSDGLSFPLDDDQASLIEELKKKNAKEKKKKPLSRRAQNNQVLRWFETAWEDNLWYKYGGANGPTYKSNLRRYLVWAASRDSWTEMRKAMAKMEEEEKVIQNE